MMKSKTNHVIIIYILSSLFIVIISHKLFKHCIPENYVLHYTFILPCFFVFYTGLVFKFILSKNDKRNRIIFDELENTNREINETIEKYNIVSKATSDTIWDWKIKENNLTWSKGIETVFGYKTSEVGNTIEWWHERIHLDDSVQMTIKPLKIIEEKTSQSQDHYRFKCADDTYKYVLDKSFLIKDTNGNGIRMIGAIQDITQQKKEEMHLKLLETVITHSRDAIIIIEPDSENQSIPKIIYINEAFTLMSGYHPSEVLGKTPDIFSGPKSDKQQYDKLIYAIKNKLECQIETISYKKNREEYWVHFSMIPVLNCKNEVSHWISIQRDISEEKRQEKEKEHLIRELTKNNKDLKQFSYITSHNLKAPLSNLIGLLHLINDIPIDNQELKEILEGFDKSTHLLNNTINDLVKVIVIKDNPSALKEEVALKEFFENLFSQLNFQIRLYKPTIKLDFENAPKIYCTVAYIESIAMNLITNSIKYKSENRKLKLSIKSYKDEINTILVFKDNGIGIDLERNKDKVFGLYQRFHNYPDSKGMGLYLVKSQVEAMGGTIEIESKLNEGTTFTLTLKNKL